MHTMLCRGGISTSLQKFLALQYRLFQLDQDGRSVGKGWIGRVVGRYPRRLRII